MDLDIRKEEYEQVHTSERKKNKGNPGEGIPVASKSLVPAKTAYNKAKQAVEATTLTSTMEGVKVFELYGNLLTDEARQPLGTDHPGPNDYMSVGRHLRSHS